MIVRSKTNLKVADGHIEPMGTVYSDVDGPLPDFVLEEMGEDFSNTRFFEILDGEPVKKGPVSPATSAGKQGAPEKVAAKRPLTKRQK